MRVRHRQRLRIACVDGDDRARRPPFQLPESLTSIGVCSNILLLAPFFF